jgi:hypothetical protein
MNESSASCHSGHLDASDLLTPTYTPYITITNPDGTTPSVDEVVSLDIPVSVNYHALMENYDGTILPYRQQKSYQNLLEAQRQTSYGTLFQYQQLLEDGTKGLRTDRGVVKSGGFGTPVDPANLWATQYSGRIFTGKPRICLDVAPADVLQRMDDNTQGPSLLLSFRPQARRTTTRTRAISTKTSGQVECRCIRLVSFIPRMEMAMATCTWWQEWVRMTRILCHSIGRRGSQFSTRIGSIVSARLWALHATKSSGERLRAGTLKGRHDVLCWQTSHMMYKCAIVKRDEYAHMLSGPQTADNSP